MPIEYGGSFNLFYVSQAHSSVEKAGLIGLVRMRYIESDEELSMRGDTLLEAITHDRAEGLLPFFVSINMHNHELPKMVKLYVQRQIFVSVLLKVCWI